MKKTKMSVQSFVILALSVIIAGLVAFIFLGHHERGDFGDERFRAPGFAPIRLTDEVKNDTVAFFNMNPGTDEVNTYCDENRTNCMYYCSSVNSESDFCAYMPHMGGRMNYSWGR